MSERTGRQAYYLAALAIIAIAVVSAVAITRPPGMLNTSQKTLQVTGTGTVFGAPDEAQLDLAVQTQASTATEATAENAAKMTSVINALTSAGISKDSIQTISYSLNPVYSNAVNASVPPPIVGYVAVNAVQVTLSDVGSVGKVLDQAISAGINDVQGLTFTLSPTTLATLQKQALQLALQDAGGQAEATASALGVTIVGPISVTPGYVFQPTNYSRLSMAAAAQTPIQSGSLQVTATVEVTYQFQ